MLKNLILIITLLSAFKSSIVAVVNDKPITENQLEMRKKLIRYVNNIQGNPNVVKKIAIGSLVDQYVFETIASKSRIKLSSKDVDNHIAEIAKQNNITTSDMLGSIRSNGVDIEDFKAYIKLEMIKSIIVYQHIPRHKVSENEIEQMLSPTGFYDVQLVVKKITTKDHNNNSLKDLNKLVSKKNVNCTNIPTVLSFANVDSERISLNSLQPLVKEKFVNAEENEFSEIIDNGTSYTVFLVCKKDVHINPEARNKAASSIENKKLMIEANRLFDTYRKRARIQILTDI